MSDDRRDQLLERDWSEVWEELPDAPALVPRPKRAQITLRLSSLMLARIKRVAAVRAVPYHVLVRSWIIDALRESVRTADSSVLEEPLTEQMNLKLQPEVLDRLKARAHDQHRPYHGLARSWIEAALIQEEQVLDLSPERSGLPPIKELMVLLLHTSNKKGEDAIRGITRLQKLLFVIEQNLAAESRFYAFNYGPFSEEVNDAAEALRLAGFLSGGTPVTPDPPSFEDMMATVVERSGPADAVEEFRLTETGHEAAERLRRSSRAYEHLYTYIRGLRKGWDTTDLIERVYEEYPDSTTRSLIRDEVEERRRKRSSDK